MFTVDVKTAFLNAHTKDGDVVYAKPPPEWQPETPDPDRRNSDLETAEKSSWPEKRTETLGEPS